MDKIAVLGSGAMGSLFAARLSSNANVTLFGGWTQQLNAIRKHGLIVSDVLGAQEVCRINTKSYNETVGNFEFILILVKGWQTKKAADIAASILAENGLAITLQNGLGNFDILVRALGVEQIAVGVTSEGAMTINPGHVKHTGVGRTIIGCLNDKKTGFTNNILNCLNESGFKTSLNENINREIWIKAIINSSINPVTSIFRCKNGYLVKNPILEKTVEKICTESTNIANTQGLKLSSSEMIKKTKQVINEISDNYSSMPQSIMNNKKQR